MCSGDGRQAPSPGLRGEGSRPGRGEPVRGVRHHFCVQLRGRHGLYCLIPQRGFCMSHFHCFFLAVFRLRVVQYSQGYPAFCVVASAYLILMVGCSACRSALYTSDALLIQVQEAASGEATFLKRQPPPLGKIVHDARYQPISNER